MILAYASPSCFKASTFSQSLLECCLHIIIYWKFCSVVHTYRSTHVPQYPRTAVPMYRSTHVPHRSTHVPRNFATHNTLAKAACIHTVEISKSALCLGYPIKGRAKERTKPLIGCVRVYLQVTSYNPPMIYNSRATILGRVLEDSRSASFISSSSSRASYTNLSLCL